MTVHQSLFKCLAALTQVSIPQSHESLLLSSFHRWVNWGRQRSRNLPSRWRNWHQTPEHLVPKSKPFLMWKRDPKKILITRLSSVIDNLQRAFKSVTFSKSHKTSKWVGRILYPNSNWENWGCIQSQVKLLLSDCVASPVFWWNHSSVIFFSSYIF